MTKVTIYSRYDPAPKAVEVFEKPSLAQQQFAKEADINTIMAKYAKTGVLVDPMVSRRPIIEGGDYENVPDLREAYELVFRAEEEFGMLSAHCRDQFGNDPIAYIESFGTPEGIAKLVALGIINDPALNRQEIALEEGGGREPEPAPEPSEDEAED